jgi:alpha-D-xyloside xylohydrolase
MTGSVRNTAQSGNARVEYRVFPGADGVFTLYEDTGDGYGYEKGEFKKTQIVWNEAQKRLFIDN